MAENTPELNPTEQVVELCAALYGGDNSRLGELAPLVSRRHQEMNRAFASFLQAVEAQGALFEEALTEEIGAVEDHFASYDEALTKIGQFPQQKNLEHLLQAVRDLSQAAVDLRWAMVNYEEKFLAQGPNRFPMVNFLANLAERVNQHGISAKLWNSACERYIHFYEGAIDEIDKSPHKDKAGVTERREAFERIVTLLEDLASRGATALTAEPLQALEGALDALEEAVEAYNASEIGRQPTSSPRANMVIHAARGCLEGRLQLSDLRQLTAAYRAIISDSLFQLASITSKPLSSALLGEEAARMQDALEAMEDALLTLQAYSDGEEIERPEVEEAIELLTAQTDEVNAATRAVNSFNALDGKVLCPHCEAPNAPASRSCQKCNRTLPQMVSDASATSFEVKEGDASPVELDQPVLSEKLVAFLDSLDALHEGKLSSAEFLELLDHTEASIDVAEQRAFSLQVPPLTPDIEDADLQRAKRVLELTEEGLESLRQGLAECRAALVSLRACAEQHTFEQLADAGRAYFLGTQKMFKVGAIALALLNLKDQELASKSQQGTDEAGEEQGYGLS